MELMRWFENPNILNWIIDAVFVLMVGFISFLAVGCVGLLISGYDTYCGRWYRNKVTRFHRARQLKSRGAI